MKDYFKNIQTVLIVVLVIVILLMRSCSGNVQPTESWTNDMENRRFDKVFLLPVWPEIHALDSERMETLEDCIEVEKFIIQAYEQMGYELIIVPKIPVKQRVAFILERL